MPLPAAILFDADGTLYDSEPLQYESMRLAAKELHDYDLPWDIYETHILRGSKTGAEVLQEQGFATDPEAYAESKVRNYEAIVRQKLKPMPGLLDFLPWCEQENISCYIVSFARRATIEISLRALGVERYFSGMVSHEDTLHSRKPDPYPYLAGLSLANVSAEKAIAIEDTGKGITSATGAGLWCAGINNDHNTPKDLSAAKLVISDYGELRDYLQRA
jgi:HAD superfamily hydrolase (TIGR01509 family)